MTDRDLLSRRGIITRLMGAAVITLPQTGLAQQRASGDNGIGGTGNRPSTNERDNGIGGTGNRIDFQQGGAGFIGTIQDFGSIIVNQTRVNYPDTVSVRIDAENKTASDMRRGHIASFFAESGADGPQTSQIIIVHEVIGPVQAMSGRNLIVFGQSVLLPAANSAKGAFCWRYGGSQRPSSA